MTKSKRRKVLPLNPCQVLIHYLKQPFISTHGCLSGDSSVHPLGVYKSSVFSFLDSIGCWAGFKWAQAICININIHLKSVLVSWLSSALYLLFNLRPHTRDLMIGAVLMNGS